MYLVFGVADETFSVGEGDVGRSGAIALFVGDDPDAVKPYANARVGCSC